MRGSILCCLLATLSGEISAQYFGREIQPEVQQLDGAETFWFNQTLDHFSNNTPTFWNQRYHVNEGSWKRTDKSPVFLKLGGEDEAGPGGTTYGAWVDWAKQYGALIVVLEHRFYGPSHPTKTDSTANLRYLTSRQALGDVKNFIQFMNAKYNFTSSKKWILFGCSYPGSLVAWARLKMPELVYGAVASSGPVEAKVDYYEYLDVVRKSLDTYSPGCSSEITKAAKSVQQMLKTPSGVETVIKKFKPCRAFNASSPRDVQLLFFVLSINIQTSVQENDPSSDKSIKFVCKYMMNSSTPDPVDRLAALTSYWNDNKCFRSSYPGRITYYQGSSWTNPNNSKSARQWLFQTCNEFGFFQTSPFASSLFSDTFTVDLYTSQCTDIFGPEYSAKHVNEAAASINKEYGGMDIKVDRVVFVQGSVDPWHVQGMVRTVNAQSPLIFIEGTTHCGDFYSPSSSDSPALKAGRAKIKSNLDKWLL